MKGRERILRQEYREAFTEVYEIFQLMPDELIEKIPEQFYKMVEEERDKSYFPKIKEPLEEQKLKNETIIILGLIYRDFLCPLEERKRLQMEDAKELQEIELKLFSLDEWEEFPKTYKWKTAINLIKEKELETDYIKETLRILINEGNTVEDEVLTVAVLKNALESKKCSLREIEEKYGKNISKVVYLIARQEEENFEEYVKRIFENHEFKYIKKIIVANEICSLRKAKETKNEIISELIKEANYILNYEEKTNRELMQKLREEIKQ